MEKNEWEERAEGLFIAPRQGVLFSAKPSAFGTQKLAHVSHLGAQMLGQGVGNFTHPPWTEGTSVFSPRCYTLLPAKIDRMAWETKK
jgi:hypothetical protein